jgi:hypothetical protein
MRICQSSTRAGQLPERPLSVGNSLRELGVPVQFRRQIVGDERNVATGDVNQATGNLAVEIGSTHGWYGSTITPRSIVLFAVYELYADAYGT